MRRGDDRWRRYGLALACIALLACNPEVANETPGTQVIAQWTFTFWSTDTPTPVTLPTRFELPPEPLDYVLRAEVRALPGERPLALTFVDLPGLATLHANGVLATPCNDAPFDRYRSEGPQCWHVPRPADGALSLKLTVHHTYEMSAYVRSPGVLSATEFGDGPWRRVRDFDAWIPFAAALLTLSTGLLYLMVFLVDRSRRAAGWMGLGATSGALIDLYWFGITQWIFGAWDTLAAGVGGFIGALAIVHFSHAQLGSPPPPRAFTYVMAAVLVVSVPLFTPFHIRPFARVVVLVYTLTILYVTVRSALAIRVRESRVAGIVMLLAWFVSLALGWTDEEYFLGLAPHAGGFHALSISVMTIALAQAGLLAYEHARSLRRADELNVDLAGRLGTLELRDRENHALTVELRRQISRRSEDLAEALSRDGVTGSPVSAPPTDGEVLNDRYRVLRLLGSGGMGTVYEVERLIDGTRLALKAHHGSGSDALARLAREGQIAAEVHHPNLVSIVDIDVARAGWLFIVMELVEGATLAEARGRYGDAAWALPVLAQIAEGLRALHEGGIVHRDLKPANILLSGGVTSATPVVKITDFGVSSMREISALAATLASITRPAPHHTIAGALTRSGAWLGTPMYMAPETVTLGSRDSGPEVDVFSFGVLAHELLANAYPFDSPPVLDVVMGRVPKTAKSLRGRAPEVAENVAALVDACLELDASSRPRAREVALILAEALHEARAPAGHVR